ncbi:MAG: ribonuclease H [Candidatus Marinimicrobia bacterium]|nr:ribonuclease H [Candidatus Neomarinimicrobiota bacterium]
MKLNNKEIDILKNHFKDKKNRDNSELEILYKKLEEDNKITLYIDGAADLHSKTAGIGGVIYDSDEEIFSFSEYLHDSTNNEAEYGALIAGLKHLIKLNLLSSTIYSDSELIVKQVNGEYRVKNDRMIILYNEVINLLSSFNSWSLIHVLRDKNKVADKLANEGRKKVNI